MKIDTLVMGAYDNNCYVVRKDERQSECIIIDTALDIDDLLNLIGQNELSPLALLLTHGHADHIAGVRRLRQAYPDIKVAIHSADAPMLEEPSLNLSKLAGIEIRAGKADLLLEDGMRIEYAGMVFEVIHTPGHTPGGVCFYSAGSGVIFSGDTIFAGSIGRTDFEYSNTAQLLKAIHQKILPLPETSAVYPGHGPATTLRSEKRLNRFLSMQVEQ